MLTSEQLSAFFVNLKTMKVINEQEQKNLVKYLKPPTVEQILSFIKSLGVTMSQFERFYGIPHDHLTKIKNGRSDLISKYSDIKFQDDAPPQSISRHFYLRMIQLMHVR